MIHTVQSVEKIQSQFLHENSLITYENSLMNLKVQIHFIDMIGC